MTVSSPFKFLDAYKKDDKDIFFGREEEVEQLYNLVFQSNLTLVYGQSGTGKTSLVQCGLANRIPVSDWFNVYIRRNENINDSLINTLKRFDTSVEEKGTLRERLRRKRKGEIKAKTKESEEEISELSKTLRAIYKHYFKPVYLIFDQFEELFILGSQKEQQEFYQTIAGVLSTEAYCRVIIIMREESIAQLYDFERFLPHIWEKRLRVEPMSRKKTQEVISKTTENFDIKLENESIPDKIIENLSEGQGRVELTYLQVFLDKLFQEAAKTQGSEITFDAQLIDKTGSIEDVLGDFLNKQTHNIQRELSKQYPKVSITAVEQVLNDFVSLEGTKRPMSADQVKAGRLTKEQLSFVLSNLENSRILRFEDKLYELSHDTLARQIASLRGAEEIAVLQVVKLVKDRLEVYDATKTLLNANELALLESLKKRLEEEKRFNQAEWAFVKKSKAANRRKRALIIGGTLALIGILTAATVISLGLRQQALVSEKKAIDNFEQLKDSQARNARANYDRYLAQGQAAMTDSEYLRAIQNFETALNFIDTGKVATDLLEDAIAKSDVSGRYQELMQNGVSLENQGDRTLVDALQKYREALALNYDNTQSELAISRVNGKLEIAFEKFKRQGDTFFNTGNQNGYQRALDNYRQANRIKADTYIQGRIAECNRLLN